MSRFMTNTSHPLIPNSQEYRFEQQYVSIHSEDRNILKYPNSSDFEIELPQDYQNVEGFRLTSGFFPAKLRTFSIQNQNITLSFQLQDIYNPTDHGVIDPLEIAIYNTLSSYTGFYNITIEEGNYTSEQMMGEIENKMNSAVTSVIVGPASTLTAAQKSSYEASGGYLEFLVNLNKVTQHLFIGNTSTSFILLNTRVARYEETTHVCYCDDNVVSPDFKHWGLPGYLGFTRCDVEAKEMENVNETRFWYERNTQNWLQPNTLLTGAKAYFVKAPLVVNLQPPPYMYMEVKLLNSIDETAPYNYSKFTNETNQTNGIVKASFAKIPLNDNNSGCSYYEDMNVANYFKIYDPPVERMRKLSIRFRYHDGMLVDFGNQDYSFTLEFSILRPQNNRAYNLKVPSSISERF
jgi:hypothetical protein